MSAFNDNGANLIQFDEFESSFEGGYKDMKNGGLFNFISVGFSGVYFSSFTKHFDNFTKNFTQNLTRI